MRVSAEGFLSIRFWISGSWLLLFYSYPTLLNKLGLTGGQTQPQLALSGMFLSTSLLCLLITISPKFRQVVVSEERRHLYEHAPFLLLGLIMLLLGLVSLIVGLLMLHGVCIPHRNIRC